MGKPYTHAKGFNITSVMGIAGLYFIRDFTGKLMYIGKCDGNYKSRINSHPYAEDPKLMLNDRFITVLPVDVDRYPLHVLEHLLIWYFRPIRNKARWFYYEDEESRIRRKAQENGLIINIPLKQFINSFQNIVIEREWCQKNIYKRYGEIEEFSSKEVVCDSKENCLCLLCLSNKEGRHIS